MYHSLTISHYEKHNLSRKVDIIIALNHFTIYLNGSTWEAWPAPAQMPPGKLFSGNEMRGLSVMNTILLVSVVADGTQNISSYRFFFFLFSVAKELRQSTINPVNEALKITECVHKETRRWLIQFFLQEETLMLWYHLGTAGPASHTSPALSPFWPSPISAFV